MIVSFLRPRIPWHASIRLLALITLSVLPGLPNPAGAEDGWPRFLGPEQNAHSPETGLSKDWPAEGPPLLWTYEKGRSHTLPVISGNRAVLIHLLGGGQETIDCLDATTGERLWRHQHPVEAVSSYGIQGAPRSSPVIDGDLVFALGLSSDLLCLRLADGAVQWQRNLDADFGAAPFFFGRGSCPLVLGDQLIVNVGGSSDCVTAFDKRTGERLWGVPHHWNGSYASPVPATLHGRECVLVFAGGMTDPPHGGLLVLDPATGTIHGEVPWRATGFASVNAASPVVVGDRVFITEGYNRGGAMIRFDPTTLEPSIAWTAPRFLCQFSTPVFHGGHLYGFSGTSEAGAELVCLDAATGKEEWRNGNLLEVAYRGRQRKVYLGRGSLLRVDGAFLALGAQGTLAWLDLTPEGMKIRETAQLFLSPETWGLPALSNGRLYLNENPPRGSSRLHCYDLRDAGAGDR